MNKWIRSRITNDFFSNVYFLSRFWFQKFCSKIEHWQFFLKICCFYQKFEKLLVSKYSGSCALAMAIFREIFHLTKFSA